MVCPLDFLSRRTRTGSRLSLEVSEMSKRFLAVVSLLRDLGVRPDQGLPPGSPGYPDQGLPGDEYPDQGLPGGGYYPDQGLPPSVSHPIMPLPPGSPVAPTHPIYGPGGPSFPIYIPIGPDHGLPPVSPGAPDQGLPGGGSGSPGTPSHPIAGQPPTIWPPLPPGAPYPSGTLWLLAILPGVGWRYVRVDLGAHPDQGLPGGSGLHPDHGLPGGSGGGAHPDQGLPPSAQPKK
jgi:hypothetical protein